MERSVKRLVLRAEGFKADFEKQVANVFAFVVFPAIIGVMGGFTVDLYAWNKFVTVILWVLIVIVFGLFWWRAVPSTSSLLTLIAENDALRSLNSSNSKEIDTLKSAVTLINIQSSANYSSRFIAAQYVKHGVRDKSSLMDTLSTMLSPLYLDGETIFGFGGSEKWSFAVYLWSEGAEKLVPVWRQRSQNHPSEGLGRSWGKGQGHVGKAFVDNQAIITADAHHPAVRQLSTVPRHTALEYDADTYRSFAVYPIGPITDTSDTPFGILVGTSDRVGRFDTENGAVLFHLAAAIASMIYLGDIDVDRL